MEDAERDAPCTACGETPQLQEDDGAYSLTIGYGMEINDLHDIPGAKTMFGNVTSQDGIGIEFGVGVRFHDVSGAEQMELF
jgi:hypothetical protein